MRADLSLAEARRVAVAAQGFGPRPAAPTAAHVRRLAARVNAFQIDSVNVLVRAHYVPAFARLGPYAMDALDTLTYRRRELFEYWGHAACLLPISLYPLMRYRMHAEETREHMRTPEGAALARVYAEVAERGPVAAGKLADPGQRRGNWWGWAPGKAALERLYDSGLVAISGRRGFERLYDLAERVIPASALAAPSPPREEAMKQLMCHAARACGVGTAGDLAGYLMTDGWRDRYVAARNGNPDGEPAAGGRAKPMAKRLVAELVEEGRLVPCRVEGWTEPAYLHPEARVPRRVEARALVTPFDSLVWERRRIERLFGVRYSIEIYTPVERRVYGYYVCLFLLDDALVARCDLKADRKRGVLEARSAFLEPGHDASRAVPALAAELRDMARWLELDRIEVADKGDLACALRACVG